MAAALLRPARRSLASTSLVTVAYTSPCTSSLVIPSSSSRCCFSSSPTSLGKSRPGEGKNAKKLARKKERQSGRPDVVNTKDEIYPFSVAYRLLKAVEVTRPFNAFEMAITVQISSHQINALRGRFRFPFSPLLKPPKLLVFAEDGSPASIAAKTAQEAGLPIEVGGTELVDAVSQNRTGAFDKVLASSGMMAAVSRSLSRNLGPKGLMPNAKRGTIATTEEDMTNAINEAVSAVDWRGDKQAVIRSAIGRVHFTEEQLRTNMMAFLESVLDVITSGLAGGGSSQTTSSFSKKAKRAPGTPPPAELVKKARGIIKKVHVSTTQGPGMRLVVQDVL